MRNSLSFSWNKDNLLIFPGKVGGKRYQSVHDRYRKVYQSKRASIFPLEVDGSNPDLLEFGCQYCNDIHELDTL